MKIRQSTVNREPDNLSSYKISKGYNTKNSIEKNYLIATKKGRHSVGFGLTPAEIRHVLL
jgi:hypothetical protein